jgi:hypothetical protein
MDDHVRFSGTKYKKGNNIIMVITINVVRYRRKILFFSTLFKGNVHTQ